MSMNTNMIMEWRYERIGITRAWAKLGRLTGQDEARKRLQARMHKVSNFRNYFLVVYVKSRAT
ncbi:hypothetical protein Hanom_Chr16g01470021 [Helianthus anomalus]